MPELDKKNHINFFKIKPSKEIKIKLDEPIKEIKQPLKLKQDNVFKTEIKKSKNKFFKKK